MVEENQNNGLQDEAPPEIESVIDTNGSSDEPEAIDIDSAEFAELSWETQVEALKQALQDGWNQAAQNLDLAQRAQAETANQRRRSDEERISQSKYANGRLLTKLLPVVEELDLAISHAGHNDADISPGEESAGQDTHDNGSSWIEGVRLIQRKLMALLESEGVTQIDPVGVVFNPMEHEALGTDESSEYPSGHVIQAVRNGYRLHDRIIQPAQVIVAK